MRPSFMHGLRLILLGALLGGTGCVNRLFFYPNRETYLPAPAPVFEDVWFDSADGVRLHAWFVPAQGGTNATALGTIVHFHGNAQNLTAHYAFVDAFPAAGFNVFSFDYRGYGRSAGRPDRRGLEADARAALDYIVARPDVDPDRLVVFAQSLGCAAALAALAEPPQPAVRAVVLDSGFYSRRTIVRDKIALIPVLGWLRWPLSYVLVSHGGSPAGTLRRLPSAPLLIIHGTDDPVIPFHHAERIHDRATEPKTLWPVPGGRHADAFSRHRDTYLPRLLDFLREALNDETREALEGAAPSAPVRR